MSATTYSWLAGITLAAALAAVALAGLRLATTPPGAYDRFFRNLALVLGTSALMQTGYSLGLLDPAHALGWRRLALLAEAAQPAALASVVLALMGAPGQKRRDRPARWRARAITLLAMGFGLIGWTPLIYYGVTEGESWGQVMGPLGRPYLVFLLLSLALGLSQIEQILRGIQDPLRYQLKFVLIGLGALAGYEIYQASQLLLVSVWRADQVLLSGVVLATAGGLIAYGLGRCRLQGVRSRVYVSQQVLYGSLTFLVIGIYLVVVGLLGEIVRYTGYSIGIVLSTGLVFTALVGLAVACSSRRVRAELRRFTARHFYRSKHDYRAKWLEVTEAFRGCTTVDAILDRLLELLSRTFGAPRISIWTRCETDGRFHQVRSINTEDAPLPLDPAHPVLVRLAEADEPVRLAGRSGKEPRGAAPPTDPFLLATEAELAVPIRSMDGLIAFVTLSRDRQGYGTDDRDLLWTMAHHAAVLLSHARLAEERRAAAGLEALHRFSAFCLHDLKNLAAGLSLVVKNAERHGQDPAFQSSAMRTIAATAQKMMALITRLSLKSEPGGRAEPVDVQQAIAETLASLNGGFAVPVRHQGGRVDPVLVPRDQLQQVLLNVLLNAQQALNGQGEIVVTAETTGSRAVAITVADSGCGIPPETFRTLFQPFRTTKASGLGIGLYQCKRILEAHGGTIRIDSQAGQGTRVRIELPVMTASRTAVPAGAA